MRLQIFDIVTTKQVKLLVKQGCHKLGFCPSSRIFIRTRTDIITYVQCHIHVHIHAQRWLTMDSSGSNGSGRNSDR